MHSHSTIINNNDLGVSTGIGIGSKNIKYYLVFVGSSYALNSKGEITVTLPALQSGFSYNSYYVYECRVASSTNFNIIRVKTSISGTTMTCTYIFTTSGSSAANAGDIYTGFMVLAYKEV